jgi:hypothetical protein
VFSKDAAIGQETVHQFLHKFIYLGSTVLYDDFVITPSDSNQDTATHQHEFNQVGCHGAIGSTVAMHVTLEKVQRTLRDPQLDWKLVHTARTYNVIVNHHCQIVSCTDGHHPPARWNDKTLVMFDSFIKGIYNGEVLEDSKFLLSKYKDEAIVKQNYLGCWVLCWLHG